MDVSPEAIQNRLKRNLDVLRVTNSRLCERIERLDDSDPQTVELFATANGYLSGRVKCSDGAEVLLASAKDPQVEARRWLDGQSDYDSEKINVAVVIGAGLGYHIAELLEKHEDGRVMVLEPSVAVVRAMLQCQDFTYELITRQLMLIVDTTRAEMSEQLDGSRLEMISGSLLMRHPASGRVKPEKLRAMMTDFSDNMTFARSGIVTSMKISALSCENMLMNMPFYLGYPGVKPLKNIYQGVPAICVAAGPSLRSGIDLLRDVQGKFPIIAVQTVLRTLLDAGIRPDFVTSLDYSELSRRFYEGLGRLDDITLVADPKVNPIVPDMFPGPVRMFCNDFAEEILDEMPVEHDLLPAGATVAHLNMYLAEHMGCNPVVMLGQDLGFGQNIYYTPGTPIHDMWAPEMNRFRTVEMLQWERIARFKSTLTKTAGQDGRDIYTDSQMFSYLQQFEQDIANSDTDVINCSAGGAKIAGTREMAFADFLTEFADKASPRRHEVVDKHPDYPERYRTAIECMNKRLDDIFEMRQICNHVLPLLKRMTTCLKENNSAKFNQLHHKMDSWRKKIDGMLLAYGLVSRYSQLAEIRRIQQDTALKRSRNLDELAKRREQLTRDIQYVGFIKEGCQKLQASIHRSIKKLEASI